MVERRLPERFSLLRVLAGIKAADGSQKMEVEKSKAENNKDDEGIPSSADNKVLIEYYKNLGRGPM